MKYAIYKLRITSISVIQVDKGGKKKDNAAVFNYKCIANNSVGTAYSMSVTVTVNGKQQIENYLL